MQKQQNKGVGDFHEDKVVYAKDLDWGNFEETRTVKIRDHDVVVLVDLPYTIQADIADIWIKYMTGIIDDRAKDRQMRDAFDKILMHVIKSPKLNIQFLRSNNCPPEFATIAMSYVLDVWALISGDDDTAKDNEEDNEESNSDIEQKVLDSVVNPPLD